MLLRCNWRAVCNVVSRRAAHIEEDVGLLIEHYALAYLRARQGRWGDVWQRTMVGEAGRWRGVWRWSMVGEAGRWRGMWRWSLGGEQRSMGGEAGRPLSMGGEAGAVQQRSMGRGAGWPRSMGGGSGVAAVHEQRRCGIAGVAMELEWRQWRCGSGNECRRGSGAGAGVVPLLAAAVLVLGRMF
eukprot:354040-Chlamydomonas_euryale.AAC.4